MGGYGGPSHCSCHFKGQHLMTNGSGVGGCGGPPPHCSCHFKCQLLMTNGVGWMGVPPPHCSCHFNSQFLMTNGGRVGGCWSSLLLMPPTKLIAAQQ